ncbi:MAG TPA: iron chelate uptake ABC transporter family permease subunit, partial [Anaerolineae bacterium]|nr:iron chelate uptake ABC transporter family permease subunit [Anaerolineae bacterium]
EDVGYLLPVAVIGLTIVYLMRWRLNLLSLDDDTSFSLGAAPGRERALILAAAVGATAAAVSVAGIVGWVGLLIPHIARRISGADAQASVPTSILLGGVFAVLCDDLARTLMTGEIPLGILTSLLGGLLFLWLMVAGELRVQR